MDPELAVLVASQRPIVGGVLAALPAREITVNRVTRTYRYYVRHVDPQQLARASSAVASEDGGNLSYVLRVQAADEHKRANDLSPVRLYAGADVGHPYLEDFFRGVVDLRDVVLAGTANGLGGSGCVVAIPRSEAAARALAGFAPR